MKFRLFAAVELPPDLRARLSEAQAALAARLPQRSVRWVNPDTIHLTLKFYGDVRGERLHEFEAALSQAVERAGAGAAETELSVQGLGVFPNPARPQVIWAGLAGDLGGVQRLQRAIEAASEPLGYPPEDRPFAPHLTLGRVRAGLHWADQNQLLDELRRAQLDVLGEFRPAQLSLMSSDRKPTGAVYTAIHVWTLPQKENASGTA